MTVNPRHVILRFLGFWYLLGFRLYIAFYRFWILDFGFWIGVWEFRIGISPFWIFDCRFWINSQEGSKRLKIHDFGV